MVQQCKKNQGGTLGFVENGQLLYGVFTAEYCYFFPNFDFCDLKNIDVVRNEELYYVLPSHNVTIVYRITVYFIPLCISYHYVFHITVLLHTLYTVLCFYINVTVV